MQPRVTVAVLQGTRVSSSDAARAGAKVGREREREQEREWERERERQRERQWTFPTATGTGTDSVKRTCRQRRTASDGRVGQGDGQRQMDVSNRDMDSIRWTCRTERRTALDGRVGQRRAALDERRRNEGIRGNGRNGGNRGEVDIPNRIQEVA